MRPVIVAACLLALACTKASAAPDGGPPSASASALAAMPTSLREVLAHPCGILEPSDAEGILGTSDLQQEEQPAGPGDARCKYFMKSGRGIVELYFQVPSRKAEFDTSPAERQAMPGIGDRAYIDKRLTIGHVDVLKGDQTFFVQIVPSPDGPLHGPGVRTAAAQLARTMVSRLPIESPATP